MQIRLHTPGAAPLRPLIECIWVLESAPGPEAVFPRIPPFGEVELAFHFEDPFTYCAPDQSPCAVPSAHVSGPRTRYFDLLPGSRVGFISVRFRPGAFHQFCPGSLAELTNDVIPFEDLRGPEGRFVHERIQAATDTPTRLRVVEDYLLRCLRARANPEAFVPAAMTALTHLAERAVDGGRLDTGAGARKTPTDQLAESLGLSRRTLQRRFKRAFGMSVQDYRRLLRFETMLKDTVARRAAGLETELGDQALRFGWFDQSHFNKDFLDYMGMAPGDYLRNHGDQLTAIV